MSGPLPPSILADGNFLHIVSNMSDVNGGRIINVGTPVDNTDATNKAYVDSHAFTNLSGVIISTGSVTATNSQTGIGDVFVMQNGPTMTNTASIEKLHITSTENIPSINFGSLTSGSVYTLGGLNVAKDIYINDGLFLNDASSFEGGPYSMGSITFPGSGTTTVTVTNSTLSSHSRVFLTTQTASGTIGQLYVSNQNGSGSFDINTTSSEDTSTVAWVVLKYIPTLCFYHDSTVEMKDGSFVKLHDLKYGDVILSSNVNGRKKYSKIISFSGYDMSSDTIGNAITIKTRTGFLIVSDTHLLYEPRLNDYVQASKLEVGSYLIVNGHEDVIININQGAYSGWISPLTMSSEIVVNGINCSCHTTDSHKLVKFIYWPLKAYLWLIPNKKGNKPKNNSWFSMKYRRGIIGKTIIKIGKLFYVYYK